jgi:hypothetical protein
MFSTASGGEDGDYGFIRADLVTRDGPVRYRP